MLKGKRIDRICIVTAAVVLVLTCLTGVAVGSGWIEASRLLGYENRLFDAASVHTIDIVMDDWDGFLDTCTSEEYSACSMVIDGESYSSVGIRGKGNTSLSTVASYGNDRYSFKVEFDQYQTGKSYHGLDKLSLNNIIQDNTYMKDFLVYQMMNLMGVASPLCSFVWITVNGEDWGLYLAVEGVEDSFLERNYGSDTGELYKPDSMSFGGGRGNGAVFDMDAFRSDDTASSSDAQGGGMTMPDGFDPTQQGGGMTMPDSFDPTQQGGGMTMPDGFDPTQQGGGMTMPDGFDPTQQGETASGSDVSGGRDSMMGGFSFGGMGSEDVKLQYIDDDPESYSNIFSNAKTDVTDADKQRLIASLKTLSEGDDISSVVDVEAVIRYLVVHEFVCNGDSYTGSMVHNYYLSERDGVLSMIPWDYNLAFGGFMTGMGGTDGCTSDVNSPIDSPVSDDISTRPMVSWIFESEEYTALYHEYYAEFISDYFDTGEIAGLLASTTALIAPYVEKDPTAFCTYEEFTTGAATLAEWLLLRAQSVAGQLDGTIPSTSKGQSVDSSAFIDASHIASSDMGSFSGGGGGMSFSPDGGFGGRTSPSDADGGKASPSDAASGSDVSGGAGFSRPDGQSGGFGGRPSSETANGSDMTMPSDMSYSQGGSQAAAWLYTGLCALALGGALACAVLFKRRKQLKHVS